MTVVDVLAAGLLLAGALLTVLAAVGLHRFPDVFSRMHAATKPATLGLVLVVVAAALRVEDSGDIAKLVLVIVLQFFTAPVAAHMIGRAAYWAGTELQADTIITEGVPRPGGEERQAPS